MEVGLSQVSLKGESKMGSLYKRFTEETCKSEGSRQEKTRMQAKYGFRSIKSPLISQDTLEHHKISPALKQGTRLALTGWGDGSNFPVSPGQVAPVVQGNSPGKGADRS